MGPCCPWRRDLLEKRVGELTAGEAERTLAQAGMAEILERMQLHRVGGWLGGSLWWGAGSGHEVGQGYCCESGLCPVEPSKGMPAALHT